MNISTYHPYKKESIASAFESPGVTFPGGTFLPLPRVLCPDNLLAILLRVCMCLRHTYIYLPKFII